MVDNRQGGRNYPVRTQSYIRVAIFMKLVKSAMGGKQAVMTRRMGYSSGNPAANARRATKKQIPAFKGFM